MADVRFSDELIQAMVTSIDTALDNGTHFIDIFKGAFPTQNPDWNYLAGTRASDRLIRFTQTGQNFTRWTTTINVMSLGVDKVPAPVTASASGVAAWFAIHSEFGGGGIVGTVTGIGGGGDLTIADVNIVAGLTYSFSAISFTFPKSVTY